jgi:hypothetical protein
MLALFESLFMDAVAIAPEYLMIVGLPQLPAMRRKRYVIVRQLGRPTEHIEI